jgi:hypothetical protein
VVEAYSYVAGGLSSGFNLNAGQAWITAGCRGDLQSSNVEVDPYNGVVALVSGDIGNGPGGEYFAVPETAQYYLRVTLLGDASCSVEIRQRT